MSQVVDRQLVWAGCRGFAADLDYPSNQFGRKWDEVTVQWIISCYCSLSTAGVEIQHVGGPSQLLAEGRCDFAFFWENSFS